MPINRKLAIYIGERHYKQVFDDIEESWHHACLFLVDETRDKPLVLQQLHYNHWEGLIAIPNARAGFKNPMMLDEYYSFPIIGGYETDVLPLWNHILRHAIEIKEQKIPFHPDYRNVVHAANCRSGVIASLKAIGLDPDLNFFKGQAGTLSQSFPVKAVFSYHSAPDQTLKELRRENDALFHQLPCPWDKSKITVGSNDL